MSKTIEIKKVHFRNLFLSFILGFSILFGLEHFGKFSYILNSPTSYDNQGRINLVDYVPMSTKASAIYYDTFLGNKITTGGNGFDGNDLAFSDGDFYKYSNKIYYITEAMKLEFKYGIYCSVIIFLLSIFFQFLSLNSFSMKKYITLLLCFTLLSCFKEPKKVDNDITPLTIISFIIAVIALIVSVIT
jgi:hypothetical protein